MSRFDDHLWSRPRPRLGEWADFARCTGMTDVFFPEPIGGSQRRPGPLTGDVKAAYEQAAKVCAACPVIDECRAYALALPKRDIQGMFAGLRPSQLHELKANRWNRIRRRGRAA